MMKKRSDLRGYLTVEASLILSVVLFLYLSLIQSFLWIYDRCILEQNLASMVVRCVDTNTAELEDAWLREMQNPDAGSLLWVCPKPPVLTKKGFKLTVGQEAEDAHLGEIGIKYEIWRMHPCEWLRMKRKTT